MNIIFWIQSPQSQYAAQAINVLAHQYGNLNFIGTVQSNTPTPVPGGIIINDKPLPIINKAELPAIDYDLIVVIGQNASLVPILKEAKDLNINTDKVILDRTICVPGFTLERYKKLRKSNLSIFSINCWGGLAYHTFGLSFSSPTINMFFGDKDYLKLLHDPMTYMNKELKFYMTNVEDKKNKYPVFLLDDIRVYMNHYADLGVDGARQKWEERRLKINWFNLLIVMYTEKMEILEEFDSLPYDKKVCFVPFETSIDSGFYIKPEFINAMKKINPNYGLADAGNFIAENKIQYYDLWDLLLYGKKTILQG